MADELRAGRVRKLLKNLIPGGVEDTDLLLGTPEARKKQMREMAGAETEFDRKTESEPMEIDPNTWAPVAKKPAPTSAPAGNDDGLLMDAPKKKPKKAKSKGVPTGTDKPVNVNGEY